MLSDFFLALQSELPFKVAWRRLRHMRYGHGKSIRIEKLRSEVHPHSDHDFVFTINIMECEECGMIWLDPGVEYRRKIINTPNIIKSKDKPFILHS